MQKEQKLVIKLILYCLILFINNSNAQEKVESYYLLDQVIKLTKESNSKVYYLSERNGGNIDMLEKYYNYRFHDRPFYTTFTYDSIADKIGYDTLQLEQNRVKWKIKYRVMDSVFSKEDAEGFLKTKFNVNHWDSTYHFFTEKKELSIVFCDPTLYCSNYISMPYLNRKRDHALISHSKKGAITTFFLFRRSKEDWVLIDRIENVGW